MSLAAEQHAWDRFEAFRVVATWAMEETTKRMARLADDFVSAAPWGAKIAAEPDLEGNVDQPLLRGLGTFGDLVDDVPGAAPFLADVDRKCLPELLRALSCVEINHWFGTSRPNFEIL